MTRRDDDTAEFPAVSVEGPVLPGDRVRTHVVGPWALGTADGEVHAEVTHGSSRRRRPFVLAAAGVLAVLAVGVGGTAVGAAISADPAADPVSVTAPADASPDTGPDGTGAASSVPVPAGDGGVGTTAPAGPAAVGPAAGASGAGGPAAGAPAAGGPGVGGPGVAGPRVGGPAAPGPAVAPGF